MSALVSSPTNSTTKIFLYGLLDKIQISKTAFSGISIQVCIPDIMRRRITKAITQAQSDPSIPPIELQNHLQHVLESSYRNFALLRDITSTQSGNHVEFICIGLTSEIIQLIQMVYPPSHCILPNTDVLVNRVLPNTDVLVNRVLPNRISYDVMQTVDDAMTKYADYFEILSPASATSSASSTSSPYPIPSIFDDRISIIPFPNDSGHVIYLGGDHGANDFAKLSELGITHILNVSDCIPNYHESTTNITYMCVHIADNGSVPLKEYFQSVFEFITSALESGGRILVHCFAGKSRSASFVIAYLIQYQKMTYMDALRHVQSHRAVVEPNFGFELQLIAFAKSLQPNA